MEKVKVAVIKLGDYESRNVSKAVRESVDLLGGMEKIFKPQSKIFVKINHLSPSSPPERGICTHPAFAKEALRLLKEFDHQIIVGDDIETSVKDCFITSGYRQVCDELEIPIINLKEKGFCEVGCRGQLLEKTYISSLLLDVDYIVNLPKLKTHSFTIFTGAVKNMYGVIPCGLRLKYHRLYIKNDVFSQMLVDIFSCAIPHLTLMDAVMSMEGEGPSGGEVRNTGLILTSLDSVALDAVASKIIGLDPMNVFTTFHAHNRGIGVGDLEKISIVGEELNQVKIRKFKQSVIALNLFRNKLPSFLYAYFQGQLILTPEIIKEKCTVCKDCIKICPNGAAFIKNKNVWIDEEACVHCMCCHEVCRSRAIKLKQRPIGRVIRGIISISRLVRS